MMLYVLCTDNDESDIPLAVCSTAEAAEREAERYREASGAQCLVWTFDLDGGLSAADLREFNAARDSALTTGEDDPPSMETETGQSQPSVLIDDPPVTAQAADPLPPELQGREGANTLGSLLRTTGYHEVLPLVRRLVTDSADWQAERFATLIASARQGMLESPSAALIRILGAFATAGWDSAAEHKRAEAFRRGVLTPCLN